MFPAIVNFLRSRYFFLSLILFILLTGSILAGVRGEDFWEHSAVVREFATHPWHPLHPLLLVNVSHAFFSPYLLIVGLLSRFASIDSLQALMIAGLFNFIYFVVSLRIFVSCFFIKRADLVSFYSLIFILFFWPSYGAGMWSGFYHFKVLPYVLPYPSTFSMATTFLLLALYYRALESSHWYHLIVPLLLTSVVVITHPTTALFTFIGIGSISLYFFADGNQRALPIGIAMVLCSLVLTVAWPYFSLFDLVRANNPEFHEWSRHLYERMGTRLYSLPIALVFALPLIIRRLRANFADALVTMTLGAVVVYGLAALSGLYGAGRILSQVAIMLQIFLAGVACELEMRVREGALRYAFPLVFLACLTVAMNTANVSTIRTALEGLGGKRDNLDEWRFLSEYVPQYDVVLTDLQDAWREASFGGKVVASIHPVHWIDDGLDRRHAVEEFFKTDTSSIRRKEIIRKFCVNYILLQAERGTNNMPYYELGTEIYRNTKFVLLRVDDSIIFEGCSTVS